MRIISIYILLCSFYITQIQNASLYRKMQYIDDFINQLMTSEKFNELADVIANRAAKIIQTAEKDKEKSLRNGPSDDESNKKPKEDQTNARDYKETNARDSKENNARDSKETNARDSNVGEKKKEDTNSKFGKIDTKAFMTQDTFSRELYLNYKHMTEELEKHKDQNEDKPKKDAKESDNDRYNSDQSMEQSKHTSKEKRVHDNNERKKFKKTRLEVSSKKPMILKDNSKENKKILKVDQKSIKTVKKINKSFQELSGEDVTREITMGKKPTKPTETNDNVQPYYSDEDRNDAKSESQQKIIRNYSSKEAEVGINRAIENVSGEHQTVENIDILPESKEKLGNGESKQKEQIVRRENGKLYTFLSSPDYDDYHQLISKRNFINTY